MLKLIDNLNLESLRESKKALDKWKKTYSRIFKIVEKIHKSVIKNKEESKTESEFVNRTAILKTVFKKDYEQRFIDFFIRHYTSKILVSDVIKLKLDNDCKNPMLDYDSFKFTIDTSNNESKIKNIGLFLRTANFSNTEINEHINTESYKKLESLFFKNSDITEWFEKFIYEIELNYNLQVNEMKKLIKFLDIVYNSLDEEKKIEVKKKLEAYNLNEEITKRNIELERKTGIKKNLIKPFIEYYFENKQELGKAENCFNEFKKNHPDISKDTYESFKKTIYANGFKLKKVYCNYTF